MRRLLELLRLRRCHPAFDGPLEVSAPAEHRLCMRRAHGTAVCTLEVDLRAGTFSVEASPAG